jgi:hypothetical protein
MLPVLGATQQRKVEASEIDPPDLVAGFLGRGPVSCGKGVNEALRGGIGMSIDDCDTRQDLSSRSI